MLTKLKKILLSDPLIFLLLLLLFIPLSYHRLLASDEGFYNAAAKIILQGKVPYRDFFYPQMPLLPYLYAAFYKIFGLTWLNSRIFTVLITCLTGGLMYGFVKKRLGVKYALAALLLFIGSDMVIGWYTVVKTYAPSTLFLLGSWLAVEKANKDKKLAFLALAGFLIGLAVNIRLFFGVCGLIYMFSILINQPERIKASLYFIAGGLVTMLPHLYFLISCPESFYFSNYGYHELRSDYSPAQALAQKIKVLKMYFHLIESFKISGYQEMILLITNALYLLWCLIKRKSFSLATGVAFLLFLVNLLPSPTWVQYFAPLVPFFIIGAMYFVSDLFKTSGRKTSICISTIALLTVIAYFHTVPAVVEKYTVTGKDVVGLGDENPEYSHIWNMKELGQKIDRYTKPGEVVMSQWPGFPFESHAYGVPGMENQFWVKVWRKVSEEEREKYKLASLPYLKEQINQNKVRLILNGRRSHEFQRLKVDKNGYRKMFSKYGVEFYILDRE